MRPLVALSVASELFPLVKTGGLADVAGALPPALAKEGVEVHTLLPGYAEVLAGLTGGEPVASFGDLFGSPARLLRGKAGELALYVLDAPHLYLRPGGPYLGLDGLDHPDNAQRFAALSQVAAALAQGLVADFAPKIVHLHDWQTGLTAAYLRFSGKPAPAIIQTIHNLAFAGLFPADLLDSLDLPPESYSIEGLEFHGHISFLKAGLYYSDAITTVSPTYAEEIRHAHAGMGFEGLLRTRQNVLSGIRNGIDTEVWDPAADPLIARSYGARTIAARASNKAALQQRLGLPAAPEAMLLGVVSRLSHQKGLDLLLECLPLFKELNLQLALLGSGERKLEAAFKKAAAQAPEHIGAHFGYEERLAHLIQAGSDALLLPSRFEPCGLTQLCALRYGATPIVARVGGLADTIIDANDMALEAQCATGLQFFPVTQEALAGALRKGAKLFAEPKIWRKIQLNGMKTDVSWTNPARHYAQIYRNLAA